MLSIQDVLDTAKKMDEMTFAELSDRLWTMGSLAEIKQAVSPALFDLHIAINMIGNWKGGGWWFVICEQGILVPHIPHVLEELGLPELKAKFESIIALFPDFTVFDMDDSAYCDIVNFLQNERFKVSDSRLNAITKEERAEKVAAVREIVGQLEDLTNPLWGYGAPEDGWGGVIEWTGKHLEN